MFYVSCSILVIRDAVSRHLYWNKKVELWGCETKMPKDYILGTLFVSLLSIILTYLYYKVTHSQN